MFKLTIKDNKVWVSQRQTLTRYCRGCEPVKIRLDLGSEWAELAKIAVFRAYDTQIDLAFTGDTIEIPANALLKSGVHLLLGLYGVNADGTVAISTVWADLGLIQPGPDPAEGENFALPPENLYQQVYALARSAEQSAAAAASGVWAGSVSFAVDDSGRLILSAESGGTSTETDLGAVSAYAQAVEGGYTGTLAQFRALLTENLRTAAQVDAMAEQVSGLAAAAAQAEQDASDAVNTANNAGAAAAAAQSAAAAAQTAAAEKQKQHLRRTLSLASGQSAWTLSCQGVGADNLLIWSPAPESLDAAAAANLKLTEQSANAVRFTADSTTTEAITVNIAIFD